MKAHKQNFLTKKGIEAKTYVLKSARGGRALSSAYRKYSRKPDTDKLMLNKFNKKNDSILVITERKWFTGDDPEIDKIQWVPGYRVFKINNFPAVISIKKIIEQVPLPLQGCAGRNDDGLSGIS